MSLTVDTAKASTPALVPAAPAPVPHAGATAGSATVFSPDSSVGPDHLARDGDAAFLAELLTHRTAGTPFCIGLFGPAGSGKSAFLGATLAAVDRLADAAEEAGLATPFLANIAVVRVEVQPGLSPAASLMQQTLQALSRSHPRVAAEASQAGLDPRTAVREAGERLNEARRRLDAERHSLDELTGRQARLTESVLFDTAGSRVDAYARMNRARIDRSLRRFGFSGDTNAAYKELVREASEPGGSLAQKPGWLRAFWAYSGQRRLIWIALVFFAIAWCLGTVIGNETALIDGVRSSSDKMGSSADWLQAHADWLVPLKQVIEIAGLVTLAMNVVRGIRFLQPVIKGAALLQSDVETRRRDLDSLLAHQTRRVDGLVNEAELASQQASEAETRLASDAGAGQRLAPSHGSGPAAEDDATAAAHVFFRAIGHAIDAASKDRLPSSASAAPARLVIGIDGFDHMASDKAAAFLSTAHSLLNRPGFVTVIAADRAHLATGLAETDPALASAQLNRLVQIPYIIGSDTNAWPSAGPFVQALLKAGGTAVALVGSEQPDATHSALDMAWLQSEGAVLEALAPFAGKTPRAVKRFVNLYRVARADPRMRGGNAEDLAALALGLALQSDGLPFDPRTPSIHPAIGDEVQGARKAVVAALGMPLGTRESGRGYETARIYSSGF